MTTIKKTGVNYGFLYRYFPLKALSSISTEFLKAYSFNTEADGNCIVFKDKTFLWEGKRYSRGNARILVYKQFRGDYDVYQWDDGVRPKEYRSIMRCEPVFPVSSKECVHPMHIAVVDKTFSDYFWRIKGSNATDEFINMNKIIDHELELREMKQTMADKEAEFIKYMETVPEKVLDKVYTQWFLRKNGVKPR